jgi:putative ABC transport system permease protein
VDAAGPLTYVVRTAPDAPLLEGTLRGVVAAADPDAVLHDAAPLGTRLRENTARSQLITRVMTIFAGIALLLAITGVHATVAHATLRRVPELAVRRALGATRGGIVALVLRQGLSMVLAGLAVGTLLAFGAARVLRRFLVGVSPADGIGLLAVGLMIVAVAAGACLGPALRAGRIAPLRALHDEPGHWSRR